MRDFLRGKKTYIVAGLLVLVALVELLTGGMTLVEFVQNEQLLILLNGLGLAALRAGVEKQ